MEPLACGGANHAVRQQQRSDRHSQAWKSAPLVWGAHCPSGGRAAGAEEVGLQLFPGSPKVADQCSLVGMFAASAALRHGLLIVCLLSSSAQPCHGSNPRTPLSPSPMKTPSCSRCLPMQVRLLLCVWVSVGSVTLSVWKEGSGNPILYL